MTTRRLVAPELLGLLEEEHWLDLTAEALPAARARLLTIAEAEAALVPIPPQVVAVPGPHGAPPVMLRIFRPPTHAANPGPAIYEIHGGGFVMGCAAMSDAANARRAIEHSCVVVAVDYRLAPETPFPGPVEDCHAGLVWLAENAPHLNVDPARIVIIGDSAGGGLAAALAILVRDRGVLAPAGLFLTYPMLDCRTGGPDDPHANPTTGEFRWNRASNRFGWAAMRGEGGIAAERMAHFSPALATDLSGLPPTFIVVGALDLFLDEDMAFAAALLRAGVPTELHVYPGAFHGFDLVQNAAIARRFLLEADHALTAMLRSPVRQDA